VCYYTFSFSILCIRNLRFLAHTVVFKICLSLSASHDRVYSSCPYISQAPNKLQSLISKFFRILLRTSFIFSTTSCRLLSALPFPPLFSFGTCGTFNVMTKSVFCSTRRIRVSCISVCVGILGLTEAVAGSAVVAIRARAGVPDLVGRKRC